MAFAYVWLGPVVIAAYSLLTVLICFSLSAYYHHLPPRWPYLSEIATHSPESNVYSLMTNHIAVLVAFWVYLKHRELVSYFCMEGEFPRKRLVSFATMLVGMTAAVGMQMSANFPKSKVPYIQTYASMVVLVCTVVYIWVHCVFSFFIVDHNIARVRLFLIRSCLAATVTSCTGSMLKVFEIRGHNFDRTTPSPNDISNGGAIYEWGVYFSMCLYLLTDAYEFRNLTFRPPKLAIPGSLEFEADRIRLEEESEPIIRRREMSFSDLPSTSMTIPLVR